jgi:EmrB/QacA subfamily drug resistance transporter
MTESGGLRAGGLPRAAEAQTNPWNALWAMLVGFFMILVDSTIVAVANPNIMESLAAGYDAVIWVTSAYLLAYAVPLLVAGRLGDRYGPKNLYIAGLAVFTVASLWCGLSGSIGMLIAARVLQGIGAALLTPQTLSTITRIFPPQRRGVAMSVWGATAGVATLVGPLAGGVLVDSLGWQWIFIVNVPIGVIGIALAVWLIPVLPTQMHRFDILGVVLSGIGMFLIVFGLQEGQSHSWTWWIWGMIATGIAALGAFVYWQAVNKNEPLIPLRIFRDRNFSLANAGGAVIGFVITAFIVPVMFYAQAVCGLSPTRAALLTAPMAVTTGALAPFVGRIVDRAHPRPVVGFGFSVLAIALTWLSIEMTPTTPIWRLILPLTALGVATAFIFAPLAATATRNLPPDVAGAASGVYNATRQVGSVIGSAAIAAFMTARISAEMPGPGLGPPPGEGAVTELPPFLLEPFAAALSQSLLLPAFIGLFGVIAAIFLVGSVRRVAAAPTARVSMDARTEVIPAVDDGADDRHRHDHSVFDHDFGDDYDDDFADDEYVAVDRVRVGSTWEAVTEQIARVQDDAGVDRVVDVETDPLPVRVSHPNSMPAVSLRSDGRDPDFLDDLEPYDGVYDGFDGDDEPMPSVERGEEPSSRFDALTADFADLLAHENGSRPGRRYQGDADEAPTYGRHSHPRD